MESRQHTSDLLVILDESAQRFISQSMNFQMNIQKFESDIENFESDAQVFDAAVQKLEKTTKDFRTAIQDWSAASQSIKVSTQQFKRDTQNFQLVIPKLRQMFVQLLKDVPATNGYQPNGAYSRCKIILSDIFETESVKDATSNKWSSLKQVNQMEKSKEKYTGKETIPVASRPQSDSNQAQVQPETKSRRRRAEHKLQKNLEPKPKLRRHSMDTRSIGFGHFELIGDLEVVDTKKQTKKGKKVKADSSTENKTMKNAQKSKEKNNKKKKRSAQSSEAVVLDTPNVSNIQDERAENTIVSTNSMPDSPVSVQLIPKNIDPEKNAKDAVCQKICLFCNTESDRMVSHYVNDHPEHEVPIARPSKQMASLLRSQGNTFTIGTDIIEGICYFCAENRNMSRPHWAVHYLDHTGESSFTCSDCTVKPKRKKDPNHDCAGTVSRVFKMNSTDTSLMGFMCKDCNYLKIHLSAINKHLIDEHGYDPSKVQQHFEKVLLVPDLSALSTGDFDKYEFVQAARRFRCTICNTQTNGVNGFAVHFGEMHNEVQQYDCSCSERITADEGKLTSKTILQHISKHSNDWYECLICANVYEHKKYVRSHMMNEHPNDEIKYKHVCRSYGQRSFVAESMVKKFECKLCLKTLAGTFANLFDHFKTKHQSDEVDVTLFFSKKLSFFGHKPNGIDTKYVCIQSHTQFKR